MTTRATALKSVLARGASRDGLSSDNRSARGVFLPIELPTDWFHATSTAPVRFLRRIRTKQRYRHNRIFFFLRTNRFGFDADEFHDVDNTKVNRRGNVVERCRIHLRRIYIDDVNKTFRTWPKSWLLREIFYYYYYFFRVCVFFF